jgi:hypothetical protein
VAITALIWASLAMLSLKKMTPAASPWLMRESRRGGGVSPL